MFPGFLYLFDGDDFAIFCARGIMNGKHLLQRRQREDDVTSKLCDARHLLSIPLILDGSTLNL